MMRPSGSPWFATWAEQGFADQSVRQVIRLNAGGSHLRVRLSNAYGTTPLRLSGASVGRTGQGAAVRPDTLHRLRFAGEPTATVAAGGRIVSDPVPLPVQAREQLTVTLYFADPTGPATYHQISMTTAYRAGGDHHLDAGAAAYTDTIQPAWGSWYYLEGVDVTGGPPTGTAIVAIGESTTDGFGSTSDGDDRYPDILAQRLLAAGRPRPVLNAGISGNKLLAGSVCTGDSALSRFARDVLDRPGVGTAIISLGMNDIMRPGDQMCGVDRDDPPVTLRRLADAHRSLIRAAHAQGIKAVGATLLPFKGAPGWTREADDLRRALNDWIRDSGEYDAIADFDRSIDPHGGGAIPGGYHNHFPDGRPDHAHPNALGYRIMADFIDLDSL
ncbi:GDSL-type esterase/lipase family protein [Nonomuraea roseoviolacea]|uniref:Lysophospholipase L1-like esterase n=1 Tax=Nonomuraea roseoviolacea subsp. carminata TaxID=160689 RepID=A0ABT1KH34_9ACTN|nr:GDSL-type esterase/lipase family protein [Nonomuraea roseoviolacea]MCP2352962.1 lysophospholipase L1-like esterase [Nonomuraea roseoviolacea subsp. carminata]